MKDTVRKFATVFGMCATLAILCSGCATGVQREPVAMVDLNRFQYDCDNRASQIAYLQSLRRSADDQLFSLSGWTGEDRQRNWLINYHISMLATRCF